LVFSSIGAIPSTKAGLTQDILLLKEAIRVEVDGKKGSQPIWFGEITDATGSCIAAITKYESEYTLVMTYGDAYLGFRFDWSDDDDGLFLAWLDGKWISLGLSQKLGLAQIMNDIRDDGCLWEVPVNGAKSWPELHKRLLSLVEYDEEVDREGKGE
jgi:hypothetical protein